MTKAERAKLVQVRLAGCPSGSPHHPDDDDWRSNIDKQPCYYDSCQRCVCPQCGFPITTMADPGLHQMALLGAPGAEREVRMIPKMNAKALVRLAAERTQQAAAREVLLRARPAKVLALALYGGTCAGGCGVRHPEELFLAHEDELLDPEVRLLRRGKEYVLGAQWHLPLHEMVVTEGRPAGYVVFCWACFKRLGRVRRRARGILHPRHPVSLTRLAQEVETAKRLLPVVVIV